MTFVECDDLGFFDRSFVKTKTNSFVLYLIIFIKEKLTSLLKELEN